MNLQRCDLVVSSLLTWAIVPWTLLAVRARYLRCYDDCLGNPHFSQHADEIDRMLFQVGWEGWKRRVLVLLQTTTDMPNPRDLLNKAMRSCLNSCWLMSVVQTLQVLLLKSLLLVTSAPLVNGDDHHMGGFLFSSKQSSHWDTPTYGNLHILCVYIYTYI